MFHFRGEDVHRLSLNFSGAHRAGPQLENKAKHKTRLGAFERLHERRTGKSRNNLDDHPLAIPSRLLAHYDFNPWLIYLLWLSTDDYNLVLVSALLGATNPPKIPA